MVFFSFVDIFAQVLANFEVGAYFNINVRIESQKQ